MRDYTSYEIVYCENETAARPWAEEHDGCDLLLSQLDAPKIDGLTSADLVCARIPGFGDVFFALRDDVSKQRLEVAQTKIFPEPIEEKSRSDSSLGAPLVFPTKIGLLET